MYIMWLTSIKKEEDMTIMILLTDLLCDRISLVLIVM